MHLIAIQILKDFYAFICIRYKKKEVIVYLCLLNAITAPLKRFLASSSRPIVLVSDDKGFSTITSESR